MVYLYRDPEGKKMFAQRSLETTLALSVSLHNSHSVKGKKKKKNEAEVKTLRQQVRDLESILLESTSEGDSNRRKDFIRQSISLYYDIHQRRDTNRAETHESYLTRDDGESEPADPESHFTERVASTGEQEQGAVTEPIASPSRTTKNPNGREVEVEGIPSNQNTLLRE